MSRAKRGFKARRRKNKILKQAKGYTFDRRRHFRRAAETVKRAFAYAFASRKLFKRDMRRLWTIRINAAVRQYDDSYSKFMGKMNKSGIALNRKMLAELAVRDPQVFKAVYDQVAKA